MSVASGLDVTPGPIELPASLRQQLGTGARDAVLHDVYDEVGGPIYDDLCRVDTQEVPELLRTLRPVRGDVLELAAGAGRLTLPMLAAGRRVTALELSGTMLDLLRARLDESPARLRDECIPVQGDMRALKLGGDFPVIVLGTTSVSLLDAAGRARLFSGVRDHLRSGGRFLLSTLDLADEAQGAADHVRSVRGWSGRTYLLAETVSADRTHRIVAITEDSEQSGRPVCVSRVAVVPSSILADEMARAGLTVVDKVPVAGVEGRYRAQLLVAGHAQEVR